MRNVLNMEMIKVGPYKWKGRKDSQLRLMQYMMLTTVKMDEQGQEWMTVVVFWKLKKGKANRFFPTASRKEYSPVDT